MGSRHQTRRVRVRRWERYGRRMRAYIRRHGPVIICGYRFNRTRDRATIVPVRKLSEQDHRNMAAHARMIADLTEMTGIPGREAAAILGAAYRTPVEEP